MDINLLSSELSRDEGVRYSAYRDSLGYLTIGVGRLIDQRKGGKLSEAEVHVLLLNDIQACLLSIQNAPWFQACQTDSQRRSLLNMRFQLGEAGLLTFKTSLGLIAQGKFKEAATNLRRSNWYKQAPIRAERICKMIEGD